MPATPSTLTADGSDFQRGDTNAVVGVRAAMPILCIDLAAMVKIEVTFHAVTDYLSIGI